MFKYCCNNSLNFSDLVHTPDGFFKIPIYILIYLFIFGFAAVSGAIGNALVILTIMQSKALQKTINAFIVNLAFADFLVSTVTMPSSIAGILLGRRWFDENYVVCAITSTICAPSCMASMHSIAWIAISRYYYIGEYAKFMKYFTRTRITLYIIFIWLLSFLVHIPNHLGWGKTRYSFMLRFCTLDTEEPSYARFYASLMAVAFITAFLFYYRIYLVLRKSKLSKILIIKRLKNQKANCIAMSNEIKIMKTSFKIFVLFVITWLPMFLLGSLQLGSMVPPFAYLYAGLVAHANSTLNFVVYFWENDIFRHAVKQLFRKLFIITKKNNTCGILTPESSHSVQYGSIINNNNVIL